MAGGYATAEPQTPPTSTENSLRSQELRTTMAMAANGHMRLRPPPTVGRTGGRNPRGYQQQIGGHAASTHSGLGWIMDHGCFAR
jgi:hypothetical protein